VSANLLHGAAVVFEKELRDGLRDRRALLSAFAFALFGPLVAGMALGALARRVDDQHRVAVSVDGGERAAELLAHLSGSDRFVVKAWTRDQPTLVTAVREGKLDLALVVESEPAGRRAAHSPARLTVLWNGARRSSKRDAEQLLAELRRWQRQRTAAGLLVAGTSPRLLRPLDVQRRDLSTPSQRGALALATVPIFLLMAAFVGGMNVAIDVTAGERERGCLDVLLSHPAPRLALAGGKWLAAATVNLGVVTATLATAVVVIRGPQLAVLGLRFGHDLSAMAAALLILAPLALLAPAVQMAIALFCRSFKEAQTYLSLLVMLPALPGFAFAFRDLPVAGWMRLVPVLGHQVVLADVMAGVVVVPGTLLGLTATTFATTAGCVAVVGVLLSNEALVARP